MRYVISAPGLSKPTLETIQQVSQKRFKSIERLLKKIKIEDDNYLEVSVKQSGDEFEVKAQLHYSEHFVVTAKHRDLRIAIRDAAKALKQVVRRAKK